MKKLWQSSELKKDEILNYIKKNSDNNVSKVTNIELSEHFNMSRRNIVNYINRLEQEKHISKFGRKDRILTILQS